jgi:hypothetical protein
VTHSRKSAAQRAKSLERLKAFQGAKPQRDRDHEVVAQTKGPEAQAPRYTVTFTRAAPEPVPAKAVPFRTPEQEAWSRAYSSE